VSISKNGRCDLRLRFQLAFTLEMSQTQPVPLATLTRRDGGTTAGGDSIVIAIARKLFVLLTKDSISAIQGRTGFPARTGWSGRFSQQSQRGIQRARFVSAVEEPGIRSG
jgi:hypothetical protein